MNVLANRVYYIGCSDLPNRIFVTEASAGRIRFQRTHELQYRSKTAPVADYERDAAEYLIQFGCTTRLATLRKFARHPAEVARLEVLLAGGDPGEEKVDDYIGRTVTVRAYPSGDVDPHRAAEQYGNVCGRG